MKRNSFSFTVFIGSEPYYFGFGRECFEFFYKIFFVVRDEVIRFKTVLDIYAQFIGGQIDNMPIAGHYFVVLT